MLFPYMYMCATYNDKLNNHVTASKVFGSEAALLVTQIVGDNGVLQRGSCPNFNMLLKCRPRGRPHTLWPL